MEHQHIYDAQRRQLCCTPQEGKIYKDAGAKRLLEKQDHDQEHSDEDGHDHDHENSGKTTFQI